MHNSGCRYSIVVLFGKNTHLFSENVNCLTGKYVDHVSQNVKVSNNRFDSILLKFLYDSVSYQKIKSVRMSNENQ